MLRAEKLCRLLCSRLTAVRTNASSFTAKSCSTIPRDIVQSKESLIPDHLRFKEKKTFFKKFTTFMAGDSAPMVPMTIILIGTHVYVLWYLFGGEFEEDFGEDLNQEAVRDFASMILSVKRSLIKFTTSLGLQSPKSMDRKSSDTELDS